MNNRPTPETDDIARGNHVVPTEWAQQLERERDEAREELHDIRLNLGEDAEGYTLIHAVCVLQQERDEAREKIKRQTDRIRYLEGATNHAKGTPLSIALKERDEARVDAAALADKLSGLELRSTDELARLEQERNEARDALMKIEDLFIDGTDIYADRENMGLIARNALEGAK